MAHRRLRRRSLRASSRAVVGRTIRRALPWDQTLGALQDILVGPVAHTVVALNFTLSAILYAVGSERQAGCLLAGGLAGCAALIVVHLLTFLSPF